MDQLRKAFGWLKQHHFWVLSVVAAIAAVACWYMSTSALGKQFKEHVGTVNSAFSAQQKVANAPFHPNANINEEQRKQIDLRAKVVEATWRQVYDRQRAGALKWPEELSADFRAKVEKMKFGDEMDRTLRQHYMDYVLGHFPKLPQTIQAQVQEVGAGGGGRTAAVRDTRMDTTRLGGGMGEPIDEGFICEWRDQETIRTELDFTQMPSHLQIWVTQEDLWAYQTLLDSIAATNQAAGADRLSNAAVRVVDTMEIGRSAAKANRGTGRVTLDPSVTAPVGVDPNAAATRPDAPPDDSGRGREGSGAEQSPVELSAKLLSLRYVDDTGKPIPFAGAPSGYVTPFGTQYKRLPVRMVLKMDTRWLNYLIAQCANQPLQVEVQEVRINPTDGGAGSEGGRSRDGGFSGTQFGGGGVETFPANPNLATVVIQGVIYIFNEPNESVLQPDGAATNTVAGN